VNIGGQLQNDLTLTSLIVHEHMGSLVLRALSHVTPQQVARADRGCGVRMIDRPWRSVRIVRGGHRRRPP
jgi:hypothetical protein